MAPVVVAVSRCPGLGGWGNENLAHIAFNLKTATGCPACLLRYYEILQGEFFPTTGAGPISLSAKKLIEDKSC